MLHCATSSAPAWVVLGWIHFPFWKTTGNNSALECHDLSFDIRQNYATFPSKRHAANETDASWLRTESVHRLLPWQTRLPGKEPQQTAFQCVWSRFPCTGAEGASQSFDKREAKPGLASVGGEERRGEGAGEGEQEGAGEEGEEEEERKRTVRINAGEDKTPKLA